MSDNRTNEDIEDQRIEVLASVKYGVYFSFGESLLDIVDCSLNDLDTGYYKRKILDNENQE